MRFVSGTNRAGRRPEAWGELSETQRQELPTGFEAVGEAQASGRRALTQCQLAGAALAQDGVTLQEAITALELSTRIAAHRAPDHEETVSLAVAWSETTLGYLHRLTCEDPMTGLGTQAHLFARLGELYPTLGSGEPMSRSHALVVLEVPRQPGPVERAMILGRVGRTVRSVCTDGVSVAALGSNRVAALCRRTERLPRQVALLRTMTELHRARVWIEGLPDSELGAGSLLDELAR